MFKMSHQHLAAFSEAAMREFEGRVLAYLAYEYPEEYERRGERALRQLIQIARRHVPRYEMNTELAVVTWVEMVLSYGEDFYLSEPWASWILEDPDADATSKVEALRRHLPIEEPEGPERHQA